MFVSIKISEKDGWFFGGGGGAQQGGLARPFLGILWGFWGDKVRHDRDGYYTED
jgi:hypothetical protein